MPKRTFDQSEAETSSSRNGREFIAVQVNRFPIAKAKALMVRWPSLLTIIFRPAILAGRKNSAAMRTCLVVAVVVAPMQTAITVSGG